MRKKYNMSVVDGSHVDGRDHHPEQNTLWTLTRQVQEFRERLAQEGIVVELAPGLPLPEQFARLQDAAFREMAGWRAQADTSRQTEEALRESEQRYRELFEKMQEALFVIEVITDAQGQPIDWRYVEVNPEVERMMGMTRAQMVGRTYRALVPHPDPEWIAFLGTVALTGKPVLREMFAPSINRWEQVNAYSPRPRQAAVLLTDITERKQAEDALRESEERYRELVQHANSAIIRWKADGTLTFFNEYAQHFFGYREDEVIGKPVSLLVPAQESTGGDLTALARDIVARPEQYVYNVNENVRRDGSRAWMAWTNRPICDAAGQVIEILAVGTDITALHGAQERERRYLYTLAHNLRVPATIIKGNLEFLLEQLPSDNLAKHQELITALKRALNRMSLMVDDFTIASRLEEGQLALHPAPVTLATYLPEFMQHAGQVLETERLQFDVPADLPMVQADPRLLDVILLSLLDNARKFSAPESPIRVTARRQDHAVEIAITDQGIGIAPDDLPHLFDRFYRVGHTRKAEGTGLGLYIAKRLVDIHGGQIRAESQRGQGSTFAFTMPVA